MGINVIDLSVREWELMRVCWAKKDLTIKDVINLLPKDRKRAYQTIKTQLDRLVEKGFIERRRIGPLWIYNPARPKREVILQAIMDFVKYVLNGDYQPICDYFTENGKNISKEDIQLIFSCIEEIKKNRNL